MALGINKDLEPLAREVCRRGGSVTVDRSNHVLWVLDDWVYRTGLTMSGPVAQTARRDIGRHLASLDAVGVPRFEVVGPDGRGKFEVHGPDGPDRNPGGFVRTFGSEPAAREHARVLGLAAQRAARG